MSVNQCSRSGCDEIMCDQLVDGRYICSGCAGEFRDMMGDSELPRFEMRSKFREFMQTEKSSSGFAHEKVTAEQFLASADEAETRKGTE